MPTRGRWRPLVAGTVATLLIACAPASTESVPRHAANAPVSVAYHNEPRSTSTPEVFAALSSGGQAVSHRLAANSGLVGPLATPVASVAASTPPVLPKNVIVQVQTEYYDIRGATATELAQQINTHGPSDQGGPFAANTTWLINWSYDYRIQQTGCRIQSAQVQVQITYLYPRWTPPSQASPQLVERWGGFMAALERHELGHSNLAKAAGSEALRMIETMPSTASCDALIQATDATVRQTLNRYDALQRAYDDSTRHGETQGASL